ncbi:MAG: CDP-alcohol phosphatidyltransferase family protein [Bryobacteraceae bacterium]|nr:CDP-alcohol phosphatidyltransferase family protein [Bryobacteraceae bacterium]
MFWLPNLLTLLRIALTPLVVLYILNHEYSWAFFWCFCAGITDLFDGAVARRFGAESRLGMVLDPAADKILQVSVFIALGMAQAVPWSIVALVFGRDLFLVLGAAYFRFSGKRLTFPPTIWGKWSTVIQIFAAVSILGRLGPPLEPLSVSLVAVATVFSGLHYAARAHGWLSTREVQTSGQQH